MSTLNVLYIVILFHSLKKFLPENNEIGFWVSISRVELSAQHPCEYMWNRGYQCPLRVSALSHGGPCPIILAGEDILTQLLMLPYPYDFVRISVENARICVRKQLHGHFDPGCLRNFRKSYIVDIVVDNVLKYLSWRHGTKSHGLWRVQSYQCSNWFCSFFNGLMILVLAS